MDKSNPDSKGSISIPNTEQSTTGIIYVILQDGWGNMLSQMAAAIILADKLSSESRRVEAIGILNGKTFGGHATVFSSEHREKHGLPYPGDFSSICSGFHFENFSSDLNFDLIYHLHQEPDLGFLSRHPRILIVADCIDKNFALIIPAIITNIWCLLPFQSDRSISSYIERRYLSGHDRSTLAALHVRIRQPSDILRAYIPTFSWIKDAVGLLGPHIKRLYICSGIDTASPGQADHLNSITGILGTTYPSLEIVIISDEPFYVDFYLLASIPHLVLTNSTFSLMSALLNYSCGIVQKVIYPDHFALGHPYDLTPFQKLNDTGYFVV